jgi:hypothetical protein
MRYALALEYDGAAFCGFQTQPARCSIQDALEAALAAIAGGSVKEQPAGRTDAGVHATSQIVHFDTDAARPLTAWVRGVNSKLPETIAVLTPVAAAVGVVGFAYVFSQRRTGSLASLSGLLLAAIAHLVLHPSEPYHWFGALMILVIVVRHEPNMDALLENREKSFR